MKTVAVHISGRPRLDAVRFLADEPLYRPQQAQLNSYLNIRYYQRRRK